MSQRFDMETVAPVGYKAMIGLEMYMAKTSLNHTQKDVGNREPQRGGLILNRHLILNRPVGA